MVLKHVSTKCKTNGAELTSSLSDEFDGDDKRFEELENNGLPRERTRSCMSAQTWFQRASKE
jgi:hypothetical protein